MDSIETFAGQRGLLTGQRLARLLGYDEKTIYSMARARAGRIPHLLLGGRIRFSPKTVAGWHGSQMEVK